MISYYQELERLLTSPKFLTFFAKELDSLRNDNAVSFIVSLEKNPYPFSLPTYAKIQNMNLTLQFGAVIIAEAEDILEAQSRKGYELRKQSLIFLGIFLATLVISALLLAFGGAVMMSFLWAHFMIVLEVASTLIISLAAGLYFAQQRDLIRTAVLEMSKELAPSSREALAGTWIQRNEDSLPQRTRSVLYDTMHETQVFDKTYSYRKIQPLFFSLPPELTVTSDDIRSAAGFSCLAT